MSQLQINALKKLTRNLVPAIVLVGMLISPSLAQLPISQLTTLTPFGARQGAELEVTVGGGDLDNNSQLVFSHPGIIATPKTTPAGEFDDGPQRVGNVYIVKIDAAVPAGIYDAQVAGDFGLSNPRRFAVGLHEEVKDSGSNHSQADAQEITVGLTINGVADANNRDYFKFTVTAGQRILLRIDGESLDSRIDATLVPFGGRFLFHGGAKELCEGEVTDDIVVLAFPDMGLAQAWYGSPDYRAIRPLRMQGAEGEIFLIEGVGDDHRATDILPGEKASGF